MKKFKSGLALALASLLLLNACSNKSNTESSTKKEDEKTAVEESKEIEESEKETSKETKVEKKNPYERPTIQPTIWTSDFDDPNYNIKGIEKVENLGLITGDGSHNKTRERFRVGGTDLGIPVIHNNKLYLWFGDTFYGDFAGDPMAGGLWRSNFLAITEDFDLSDGLDIEDVIGNETKKDKVAKELVFSKKIPESEHTVIPTGSLSLNGKLYVYFMSVNRWGTPGRWDINYGGLAVSDDDGESFKKIESFELDPEKFGQFSCIEIGDYIYGIGLGGGRFGNAYLARVKKDEIEDVSKYEYLVSELGAEPEFAPSPENASKIITMPVGEPSIMYNEYLGEYMITYLNEAKRAVVMRTAKELWMPWSDELVIASGDNFPGLYCGFVHPDLTEENGKIFYFIMSQASPVYNSILFKAYLK